MIVMNMIQTKNLECFTVVSVKSTSSHHVIHVLDKIRSMFGVPEIVKFANGPPFPDEEFHTYAQYHGFTHHKLTPYHPKANGECE